MALPSSSQLTKKARPSPRNFYLFAAPREALARLHSLVADRFRGLGRFQEAQERQPGFGLARARAARDGKDRDHLEAGRQRAGQLGALDGQDLADLREAELGLALRHR